MSTGSKLEANFNVSQLAVENIGQEITSICQKIHRFTVKQLEKRLGKFLLFSSQVFVPV